MYYENELYHHGVKGQKWGVRRYQNADGTLTDAGKKRKARQDASDEKYRQRQIRITTKYYDNNRYGGLYGITNVDKGINSLTKSMKRDEAKYQKTGNEKYRNRAMQTANRMANKELWKQYELEKVRSLTSDQIKKEKVAVGKDFVQHVALNVGINAILLPTTGMAYMTLPNPQSVISETRLNADD